MERIKEAKGRKREARYKAMMMKIQKEKKIKTAGVNRRQQKQLEMQTNAGSAIISTCQADLY